MTERPLLLDCQGWTDYELLDSGAGAKLERFGKYTLARPETQAIWRRHLPASAWQRADATFERGDDGQGAWTQRTDMPEHWELRWEDVRLWAELGAFRHTGVFPEQASHWRWLDGLIRESGRTPRVLELFGYSGITTLVAARAGAQVTYVDASRPAMAWARRNQEASGLTDRPIRWLLDDALKFVQREQRRGATYDAIAMDPPVFGRGPKGEIWRFQSDFPQLFAAAMRLLSDRPLCVLVNAYAIELSSLSLANLVADELADRGGLLESGELTLSPRAGGRSISTGIFARWRPMPG